MSVRPWESRGRSSLAGGMMSGMWGPRRLVGIVAVVALASGCTDDGLSRSDSGPQPAGGIHDLQNVVLDGAWRLTSARIGGEEKQLPVEAALTLVITAQGNQAYGGCTVLSLAPTIKGDGVTLKETGRGSMRSCPPRTPETDLDAPYLDALTTVDHGERSGSHLTLTGPGTELTFAQSTS
jgi:hypothetical protein